MDQTERETLTLDEALLLVVQAAKVRSHSEVWELRHQDKHKQQHHPCPVGVEGGNTFINYFTYIIIQHALL